MKFGNVPHVDKPISRIVMGTDFLMGQDPWTSFRALDAFWKAGGNTFDTAHVYNDNSSIFGAWVRSRGLQKEAIFFDKGCHPYQTKRVTRDFMLSDIRDNHRRIGVEYTDFFVLHRDDPEVPVGEIVEWLNEYKREGLIGAFGGSNWHHTRIAAANTYAAEQGLQGFSLNNPNLSLAHAQEEMWAGAYTIDEAGRAWHVEQQFPLFSWSSMARGYFAHVNDAEVNRVWDNEANRARRARAEELAAEFGLTAPQIAMAWTLNQPYPVFALGGLRNADQVAQAIDAIQVDLTPEQVRWLEHGK